MATTKTKKSRKQSDRQRDPTVPILSKKELRAKERREAKRRRLVLRDLSLITLLGAFVAIVLFPFVPIKLVIAGAGGVVVLTLSYKYPKPALWGFLIYMPFSGTITYWIGGGNALFQLAKDGFFFPALLAMYQQCKRERLTILVDKRLKTPLTVLLTCSLLTLVFVNVPLQFQEARYPVLQGLLGLKVFMGYIPLIFCTFYLIKDKKALVFAARLHLILAIACCLLGIAQYYMLYTGICQGTRHLSGEDLFKATLDSKCLVGGSLVYSPQVNMIRLPGTFVAPWQWGWFLIANAFFTFGVAFSDPSIFIWRPIGMIGMGLIFVNALISGQRIALALVPFVTVILLVLTGQVANLKRFIPIALGLGLLLGFAAVNNPDLVQERIDSLVGRSQASPPHKFIEEQFHWAIKEQRGPLGRGLGKATNSTRVFGKTALVETYYSKVLYEVGPFGTGAFIYFVTVLTVVSFKAYRSVKEPSLRSYGACFWVFVLFISYFPYYYPLDVDPVAVYYWFAGGILLRLPAVDKQEQEKLKLLQEQEALENTSKFKKKAS